MSIKAVAPDTGDEAGQFKALVSVFGNVDHGGDVVMPGAFAKSLMRWAERGDAIPVVWAHRWDDPFAHIGAVKSAVETSAGLEVEAQLDLDNPTAKQVHRLMRGRRIKAFSFGYSILDATPSHRDGKAVQELRELDLHEVGPCMQGMNEMAELLDVKSASPRDNLAAARAIAASAEAENREYTPEEEARLYAHAGKAYLDLLAQRANVKASAPTPAQLAELAGPPPVITPAALTAWIERSAR